MKLTNPKVIKHLKENYYIRRKCWDKGVGYYHNGKGLVYVCLPLINPCGGFSLSDIEANDWVLCPKE